eukprot:scaffold8721_cov80-Phaeocystis_antarctica.AAC.27
MNRHVAHMRPAAVAAAGRASSRGLQTVGRSGDGPGGAEPAAAVGSKAPPVAEIRLSATASGSTWLDTAT